MYSDQSSSHQWFNGVHALVCVRFGMKKVYTNIFSLLHCNQDYIPLHCIWIFIVTSLFFNVFFNVAIYKNHPYKYNRI
jgi:hypothetical protein